jgi:hypothetical protein
MGDSRGPARHERGATATEREEHHAYWRENLRVMAILLTRLGRTSPIFELTSDKVAIMARSRWGDEPSLSPPPLPGWVG